jgi:hypothetical protein
MAALVNRMAFDEMFDSSRDMEDFEGHHNRDSI